jgi:hypothetical protein
MVQRGHIWWTEQNNWAERGRRDKAWVNTKSSPVVPRDGEREVQG